MGKIPTLRMVDAPPFFYTAMDLLGPIRIKDSIRKRGKGTVGKGYGVVFTCAVTRAVHADVIIGQDTLAVIFAIRRFMCIRGQPGVILADPGSQLIAASKEMENWRSNWSNEQLVAFGASKSIQFKFCTADAQWENGVCESMVRNIKRALKTAIGDTVLTLEEAVTYMMEAASIVNQRPIGIKPNSKVHPEFLTPNHCILGRATSRICAGPFQDWRLFEEDAVNFDSRFIMVQSMVTNFWKAWIKLYFPTLLIRRKWHTLKRNLRMGDLIMFVEDSAIRGTWQLARVVEVYPDESGVVRNVKLGVKTLPVGEKYSGVKFHYIYRHANKIVVLLPVEEQDPGTRMTD